MATLHLLSHSPFSDGRFNSCLPLLGDTDALLLAGDATYALTAGTKPATKLEQLPEQVALFALEEDVQARALGQVIIATDDDRIVEHVRSFGGNVLLL